MKVEDMNGGCRLKKVSYTKALAHWNAYMKSSGIRAHCQEECKGACCKAINPKKCKGKCHEKLACVAYVCGAEERGQFHYQEGDAWLALQKNWAIILQITDDPWHANYNKGTKLRRKLDKLEFYIPEF